MAKQSDLTSEARAGYDGNPNKYLYSSPCWYAHSLGVYLHSTGRAPPYNVKMSRGSSMHANGKRWKHSDQTGWSLIEG